MIVIVETQDFASLRFFVCTCVRMKKTLPQACAMIVSFVVVVDRRRDAMHRVSTMYRVSTEIRPVDP